MDWNVFYHDVNAQVIKALNIFEHGSFRESVERLKGITDKEAFARELMSYLRYFFWCKSEYEVVISPWCGGRDTKDIKVDIFTQVVNNWEIFLDYIWNSIEKERNR